MFEVGKIEMHPPPPLTLFWPLDGRLSRLCATLSVAPRKKPGQRVDLDCVYQGRT